MLLLLLLKQQLLTGLATVRLRSSALNLLRVLIVFVGDEMCDLFVQEEFDLTAEPLDGGFDLVR